MKEISTREFTRDEARSMLTSLLVPRPVAWISTVSNGDRKVFNLAPFSSIAPICNKPMLLSFACGRKSDGSRKDTGRNVLATREFVVNLVGPDQLENVSLSANEFESGVDEFALVGVTAEPSRTVRAPRVVESFASLECTLYESIEMGDPDCRIDLLVGAIQHVCIRKELLECLSGTDRGRFCGLAALDLDWYLIGGDAKFLPQPVPK